MKTVKVKLRAPINPLITGDLKKRIEEAAVEWLAENKGRCYGVLGSRDEMTFNEVSQISHQVKDISNGFAEIELLDTPNGKFVQEFLCDVPYSIVPRCVGDVEGKHKMQVISLDIVPDIH